MDAISYVNIFETKGLEYLLVVAFLLSLVIFARFLTTPAAETTQRRPSTERLRGSLICPIHGARCPLRPSDALGEGATGE